jgi:hypothetical protein
VGSDTGSANQDCEQLRDGDHDPSSERSVLWVAVLGEC